ncbi:MAG: SBBP repeat-containing protein, partial [Chlorobiota bacterium]
MRVRVLPGALERWQGERMQRAWALFLFLPTFAQPTVDWSTYLGSPAQDELRATAIASDGSIVVVGWSLGVSFPVVNAWQGQNQGREDAVIVKFSSSGSLLWSTYLGGSDNDRALGVAVDSGGRIYVVGVTASSDFPVANAFQSTKAAGSDAFIACFSVDGRRLWATYYGGNGEDGATAVAVDAQGLLDVAGYTSSANFPVTTNAVQNRLAGYTDAFVLQLRPDGARVWATYFGGSGPDYATAICVDDRRNIYICGETSSSNFPLRNAFQQVLRGGTDAFVASFGPFGVWGWSTYYGGTENDRALGIAVTPERWVTVVGMTASQNLQVTPVWQLQYAGGGADGFVVQFSASGGLRWATFLGGGENDVATSCAVDPLGNLYVAGRTASSNFPQIGVGQRSTEGDDCFLLKLHRQGMPQWSLLLGGSASDAALGIAVDSAGNVALVGSTTSTDVSLGPPSYQSTLAGLADGLLVRLSGYLLSLELEVAIDTVLCTGDSLLVRWRVRGGEFGANNMFRVELSDAGGSFQVPLVLDSVVARRDTALRVFVPFQPPGGQYRIRVSASQPIAYSNDNGRLLSAQQRPQEPQLEIDGDTVFCEGRQVVLYVLQPQPGVRYRWWRDSIVVAEDATAYAASQSGRYSVEAYNACGSV